MTNFPKHRVVEKMIHDIMKCDIITKRLLNRFKKLPGKSQEKVIVELYRQHGVLNHDTKEELRLSIKELTDN